MLNPKLLTKFCNTFGHKKIKSSTSNSYLRPSALTRLLLCLPDEEKSLVFDNFFKFGELSINNWSIFQISPPSNNLRLLLRKEVLVCLVCFTRQLLQFCFFEYFLRIVKLSLKNFQIVKI